MSGRTCFRSIIVATGALLPFVASFAAQADPVEDFYKGKTVRLIVGFPAGGGYDIYARPIAEFMSQYIPGKPTIIVQNMLGGSGLMAARYIFEAAPRDGTVLGMVAQTLPLDSALQGDKAGLDASMMPYVGRMTTSVELGHGMPGAKFSTFEDARRAEIIAGAAGGNNPSFLAAAALNKFAGARFRIVSGYRASIEVQLAAERGEVEFVPSASLNTLMVSKPDWITKRQVPILYQGALKRHPLLPDVPTMGELGLDEDGKSILRLIASTGEIGRALNTTPGVPQERLDALRKAFKEMIDDPKLKATLHQRNMAFEPADGDTLSQIALEITRAPRRLLEQISNLTK